MEGAWTTLSLLSTSITQSNVPAMLHEGTAYRSDFNNIPTPQALFHHERLPHHSRHFACSIEMHSDLGYPCQQER